MAKEKDITTENFLDNSISIEALLSMCNASSNESFGSATLSKKVEDSGAKIVDAIKSSPALKDHYTNTLSATGDADKAASFTSYGFSNDSLNYPLWTALYNDSWVIRRAIDKPAQDQVNAGFILRGNSDYSDIYKQYEKNKSDFIQLLTWGALYGGSVGIMLFENIKPEEMEKPITEFDIKGKRFKIYVTDRWYGGYAEIDKLVTNMADVDYGKPAYYNITFANGKSVRVHHSYVLRYEHRWAPPLIKNGMLQGWGYAEGAHILNELSRDDQLKASITSLVNKALIEVIKMSGMRGVFMGSDKANEGQLKKRLEMVNWGRTYNSLTFLDKEDDYQQFVFSGLTGLSDLMEKNMWLVAAAVEMPGILFGELKGGLATDSDAIARYSQVIKNRCDSYYRAPLYKYLKILWIVYDMPGTPDFDFITINAVAENKEKVAGLSALAQALGTLQSNGIISSYQYARSIQDYILNNSLNIIISEEHLNKLKLEEENSMLETIKDISKKHGNPNPNSGIDPNLSELSPNLAADVEGAKEDFQNPSVEGGETTPADIHSDLGVGGGSESK